MEKFWKTVNLLILLTLISTLVYGTFIANIFLDYKLIDYIGYVVLLTAIIVQIILTIIYRKKGIKSHIYLSTIFFIMTIHIYLKSTLGRCTEYSKKRNYFYQPCYCVYNPCSLSKEILSDINRLDSLTKVPEIRKRILEWNKANYDEPSLLYPRFETYRYKLSSTNYSVVVRIEKRENKYFAIKKVYNGTTGDPNLHPIISNFQLSKQTWDSITNGLHELNFWIYPTTDSIRYIHGYSCSIEGYNPIKNECTSKNYHCIERECPKDSNIIKMCDFFKRINGKNDL